MRIRLAAALCLLSVAGSARAAEPKKAGTKVPVTTGGPQAVVAPNTSVARRPDLIVHLKEYPSTGVAYPYQSFWVENRGTIASPPTKVEVTCTRYKNDTLYGPCSSTGKLAVPALPAPTKTDDPAARFSPNLPFTPGPITCDQFYEKTGWVGITKCVLVAVVDPENLVTNEFSETNNTVTITIPAH